MEQFYLFAIIYSVFALLLLIFHGFFTNYSDGYLTFWAKYPMFQDVHVMIYVGFGFLMAFLKYGGMTAIGFTLFIGSISMIWGTLIEGFWARVIGDEAWDDKIHISLDNLATADFLAAAVLISFGALIGRVSLFQVFQITVIEAIFYHLLGALGTYEIKVDDIGGSMMIHTFGAYFGLSCSAVLNLLTKKEGKDESKNTSSYSTNVIAMVGTVFLWVFWPSFNAYLAPVDGTAQRVIINTYVGLIGSTFAAFITCVLVYKGKFRCVEIQNSTLAGGVAIGTAANMLLRPYGALLIGMVAGVISVIGYRYLTPILERKGIKDTCGINNLHGMPGILGGLVGIFASARKNEDMYDNIKSGVWPDASLSAGKQAGYQCAILVLSVLIGIVGGAITGAIISFSGKLTGYYDDNVEWDFDELDGDLKKEPIPELVKPQQEEDQELRENHVPDVK